MAGLWNGKKLRLSEVHRFPNEPVVLNGSLRWDVLRLWMEIQKGIAAAAKSYGTDLRSIGVDTWGVDYVLLSKSREVIGAPHHYRDQRTRGMMQKAFRKVSRQTIFAESGLQFLEINTLYQLLALQTESPEVLENARHFLMMPDFFHWCLSGEIKSEFTNGTTTQFLNPRSRRWSRKLLKKFQLPFKILPRLVKPGTRLGPLRKELQKQFGVHEVDVVVPATHDTASAVAAVPTTRTGKMDWAYISSGTWSLMGIEVGSAQLSSRVMALNLTNEGGVQNTFRLLKNITGLWLLQRCKRSFDTQGRGHTYGELVEQAQKAKPLASLVDPDEAGFLNPTDMPETIRAYCRRTSQPIPASRSALVRCILESLALKYSIVLKQLEEISGVKVKTIHIVGGGSQNRLLNQFTANACRCEVIAGPVEATAMGNVLTQLLGCGAIRSLSDLRKIVRNSCALSCFSPRPGEVSRWTAARNRFAGLIN
jgi:rhamnulokinase